MNRSPLLPPFWLALHLLGMIAVHFVLPLERWIEAPWNLVGVPLLLAGIGLALWCDRLFRKHKTTIKPFQESSALLTQGPYRLSRNPIYLGMVLILIGTDTLLGTLGPAFLIPVFALRIDRGFIRREEAMLEQRFGSAYLDYARRVRRWI